MAELRERLQAALGAGYRVEKELGGGGMSRVFLAEEVRLGRRVVVKVLPPEMSMGVSVDRFEREIQLAAKLQHPHVVPLLTAGASDDLLYYIMPFIEGESLRAKLAREGELPIGEAVRILREVVDALAYAHRHGVVHRDIKPDNVLLSEGHALVTDFGVAKAVAESTGRHTLTSMGVALGTPAYMAPEQAVADPHVDHRADIYAAGVLAYEMVCGRLPFSAGTPQALLAAHVTEAPEPALRHRSTLPEALNALIMRCLEKKAADRWQKAEELLPHLDAVLTPTTGGITPTGTQPHPAVSASDAARAFAQAHPGRVAGLFAAASLVLLFIVYAIVQLAGLPDWVFYGAMGLLVAGLPIMLLTGRQERRRAAATMTGTRLPTPTGMHRYFTWRKALLGGGVAFTGLTLVTGGFMASRLLGVGPGATLLSKGVIGARERIVLADFDDLTADSTLGETITELLRIDLAQSPTVSVYDAAQVAAVLARMQRSADARVTAEVANEIAAREGLKALLLGDVRPLGDGFVLSARLVASGSGEILWAGRENVADANDIAGAVDRLSASLRERAGESLRTIRADPPLENVTTTSLEALQLYAQSDRANNNGDRAGALALLDRAIARDSNFAMAYRKLGIVLRNMGLDDERWRRAFTRAFEQRQRLTERERYLTEAAYFAWVTEDHDATIAAYQAVLEKYPDDRIALNNLSIEYGDKNRVADALELNLRAIDMGVAPAATYDWAINRSYNLGQVDEARELIAKFAAAFPANPDAGASAAALAASERDWDSARVLFQVARAETRGRPSNELGPVFSLSSLAGVRGRLAESRSLMREGQRLAAQVGMPWARELAAPAVLDLDNDAWEALWFHGDPDRAARLEEEFLRRDPPARHPPDRRGYLGLANFFARAGRVDRAREMVRRWETEVADDKARKDPPTDWHNAMGMIALAEGRLDDALQARRRAREQSGSCVLCNLFDFAEIHDRAGRSDSAIAYYEQWVNAKQWDRLGWDFGLLWLARRRLGELYEAKGDRQQAVAYYGDLLEQWKDADAQLQPIVRDVRGRVARLVGEKR